MLFQLVASLALAGSAAAQAAGSWQMPNVPDNGLNDITFTYSFADAPHESGFYFANQMGIEGGSNSVTYTGFQPRPDANGKSIIHAVFSSFLAGSTSTDSQCKNGADGGAGVSCAVEFEGSYDDKWSSVVTRVGNTTTWTGIAVNVDTGAKHHIGTFKLPAGTQGILDYQALFLEYYPWNNNPSWTCKDNVPYTQATYYPPTTHSSTVGDATAENKAYIQDRCKGYGEVTTSNGALTITMQPSKKP